MNNDVQAEQIADSFLDDTEDVATAKASFKAAFEDAAAGGLAALQEPAPVHVIPEPAEVPVAVASEAVAPIAPAAFVHAIPSVHLGYHPLGVYAYGGALPYGLPAFGLNHLPYNGLPLV